MAENGSGAKNAAGRFRERLKRSLPGPIRGRKRIQRESMPPACLPADYGLPCGLRIACGLADTDGLQDYGLF